MLTKLYLDLGDDYCLSGNTAYTLIPSHSLLIATPLHQFTSVSKYVALHVCMYIE